MGAVNARLPRSQALGYCQVYRCCEPGQSSAPLPQRRAAGSPHRPIKKQNRIFVDIVSPLNFLMRARAQDCAARCAARLGLR